MTRMQDLGEFDFIRRVADAGLFRPDGVVRGIGDDAAVFRCDPGTCVLATTDLLLEGVHFRRSRRTGFDLGHKALAVNLSDIAAMGGEAREAFVGLGVPPDCEVEYLRDFYRGMAALARRWGVNILGGDTTGSPGGLVVAISVVGRASPDEVLCRDGARPGDVLFTTGPLGDSRAGLEILEAGGAAEPGEEPLVRAHRLPEPHLAEGRFLSASGAVHAAIDVSDGLSSDVGHLADRSGVGVRIFDSRLPVSDALAGFCRGRGRDPADMALAGGEDYVLLAAGDPAAFEGLAGAFRRRFGRDLHPIGEATAEGHRVRVRADGKAEELSASGWDHFRRREEET